MLLCCHPVHIPSNSHCFQQKISGLQHCPDLKKVYLYDNKITEIKNLKFHVNIEVLWLNNNYISQIQVCRTFHCYASHLFDHHFSSMKSHFFSHHPHRA